MFDIAIIGGGPAGLTATVYAARKNLDVLLVSMDIGGQVNKTMGVENYMGYQFVTGPELMAKFGEQVSRFPVKQVIGETAASIQRIQDGFEAILTDGDRYQSRVVIYATGKRSRSLDIPGEAEYVGKGVSYCAICDGPVFAEQRVAIVGGGNSAVSAALDMAKVASHVDLVSLTKLNADAVLVNKLVIGANLSVYEEHRPVCILGDVFVQGLDIADIKTGESKHLDVTGVFVEIGLIPNSDAVRNLVKLNERGEVLINCSCETGIPGLYAAGDVTDIPEKQIVVAAGEGAKAALQAHRYLQRLPK
jgi:NADH-dependent peroxiredoxin subunit F